MSKRLMHELKQFYKNNEHKDMFIYYEDNNIQQIKALFIGPDDTPYQGGFFYFDMDMSPFPMEPPKVKFLTPLDSNFRLHPNLYQAPSGKVCLSLLGTWGSNTWSPVISIEKILITIQALLDNNPISHEPSHEKDNPNQQNSINYAIRARYLTIISIPQMMKRTDIPDIFKEHMTNYIMQQFSSESNVYEKSWQILDKYEGKNINTFHGTSNITNYRFNIADLL